MKLVSIIIWKMYFLLNKRGYNFVKPGNDGIGLADRHDASRNQEIAFRFEIQSMASYQNGSKQIVSTPRYKDNRNERTENWWNIYGTRLIETIDSFDLFKLCHTALSAHTKKSPTVFDSWQSRSLFQLKTFWFNQRNLHPSTAASKRQKPTNTKEHSNNTSKPIDRWNTALPMKKMAIYFAKDAMHCTVEKFSRAVYPWLNRVCDRCSSLR